MFRDFRLILFILISPLLCVQVLGVDSSGLKSLKEEQGISSEDSTPLILQDSALVRLGGQVFFLNDVDRLQESYKSISCLGNQSYIERFLKNSNASLIPRPWQANNIKKGSQLPEQLQAFILIEKLKLSSVSSASTKLTTLDLVKLSKKCSHLVWNELNSDVKSLFLSEIYLRQRFSGSKELDSALEEFVTSLNLQHKHELLRIRPSQSSLKALEAQAKRSKESMSSP